MKTDEKSLLEAWGNLNFSVTEAMEAVTSVFREMPKTFDFTNTTFPTKIGMNINRYSGLRNLSIQEIIERLQNAYILVNGEFILTDIHEELRMTKENSMKNDWTKDLDKQIKQILSEDLNYLLSLNRKDCAIFKEMNPLTFCKFLIGEVWVYNQTKS